MPVLTWFAPAGPLRGDLRPLPHDGLPPAPHDIWIAWNADPLILAGLVLFSALYAAGVQRLWRRAGAGRGISRLQAAFGGLGLGALWVALVSPLDALALALFSAHMVQHLFLMSVAAPLLVAGRADIALVWALPRGWRQRVLHRWRRAALVGALAGILFGLPAAWLLQSAVLWLWHLPAFYQAALLWEPIHAFEHVCFFGAALLFWQALAHAGRGSGLGYPTGILAVFTFAMQSTLLGALLTFAAMPWYPVYAGSIAAWGLTLLEDQQLAGLIMWIPGGLVYLGATLWLLSAWFSRTEREAERRERAWAAADSSLPAEPAHPAPPH